MYAQKKKQNQTTISCRHESDQFQLLVALSRSRTALNLLSDWQVLEGCAQTHTIDCLLDNVLATSINLADQTFAVSVDDKTEKIGTHVMTTLFIFASASLST
jgi:hypothetical protein